MTYRTILPQINVLPQLPTPCNSK